MLAIVATDGHAPFLYPPQSREPSAHIHTYLHLRAICKEKSHVLHILGGNWRTLEESHMDIGRTCNPAHRVTQAQDQTVPLQHPLYDITRLILWYRCLVRNTDSDWRRAKEKLIPLKYLYSDLNRVQYKLQSEKKFKKKSSLPVVLFLRHSNFRPYWLMFSFLVWNVALFSL